MKNKVSGSTRHNISNSYAQNIAKQINSGQSIDEVFKPALIDAQISNDWRRVAVLENSLISQDNRIYARKLESLSGRGILISKLDNSSLSKRIPDGFEFGIAWFVTSIFVRSDGIYDNGLRIADEFLKTFDKSSLPEVEFGNVSLCLTHVAFGPAMRSMISQDVFKGHHYEIYDAREKGRHIESLQKEISNYQITPAGYLMWGCYVTGTNDPNDLLNEQIWAPGLDVTRASSLITKHLAKVSIVVDGDTHLYPKVIAANDGYNFCVWMLRENTIVKMLESFDKLEDVCARISVLSPNSLPYMDQILLTFWTKYGMLKESFGFPRSDQGLSKDVSKLTELLRSKGIVSIEHKDPAQRRGSNDVGGLVINDKGEWESLGKAGLGRASMFLKTVDWESVETVKANSNIDPSLPSVLLIEKLGALDVMGKHYQPSVFAAIKEKFTSPGDPYQHIENAVKGIYPIESNFANALFENEWAKMMPDRGIALATQFKIANGAIAVVSQGLQDSLKNTDIGSDCPALFIRPSFDMMYLRLNLDTMDVDEFQNTLDGVLVQRWVDGDQTHLILDSFLKKSDKTISDAILINIHSNEFVYEESNLCLKDIYNQIKIDDSFGKEILKIVSGILLYINSKDARIINSKDHENALKALYEKNRKKRKKEDYDKLNKSFDHIQIGPESDDMLYASSEERHHEVRMHYRRGFVRFNQRYGPGLTLIRPVFISPVLVNAKNLLDGDAKPKIKQYNVNYVDIFQNVK